MPNSHQEFFSATPKVQEANLKVPEPEENNEPNDNPENTEEELKQLT